MNDKLVLSVQELASVLGICKPRAYVTFSAAVFAICGFVSLYLQMEFERRTKNGHGGIKARSPPGIYQRMEKAQPGKGTGGTRTLLGEESR